MFALFQMHSGLRYLVLLAGLVALVVYTLGFAQNRPFTKRSRLAGSIFLGLLDLQVLLGIVLAAVGYYSPKVIGHSVMMLLAAALGHVLFSRNRKLPQPGFKLPLIAVTAVLVLICAGILAIGRMPWAMTMVNPG